MIMKRGFRFSAAAAACCLLISISAFAAGTTFTNIAQDQSSGLYHSDFSAGTAIFDYNNDGFDDIVVNNYYTPNRLYMSNGNGTFSDVGAAAGVSSGPHTLGIATADIDGSGYMDFLVFAENYNPGFLYVNNGNGTFTDAQIQEFSIASGYDGYACAFADYDLDGLLDVFYAGRLFQNQGQFGFVEVNSVCGLGNLSFVAHAAFGDIDNDGDPDLVVSRQHGNVALFRNDGQGNFTNITSNIEGIPYALCGSFADIDNDGDLDLFLSYSNVMYFNDGTGRFTINNQAGTYHRYTRGAVFADFDNDGDPDLVLANEDGSSTYHENHGGGVFVDVTAEVGMDNEQQKAGGVAVGDIEGDGDLDLYISKTDYLINPCFRNNLNNNNAIDITPRGTVSNYSGIGARVYLYGNGHIGNSAYQVGMAELTSTSGFHAGTTGRVHLGTGATGLFDVRVVFPSGVLVDTAGVSSGSRLMIYESGEIPNRIFAAPGTASITQDVHDGSRTISFSLTDSKNIGAAWTASSNNSWITVLTQSGTTPATLTASVDPAGLGIGLHRGSITVDAPDAGNSPLNIAVNLTLTNYFLENAASAVGLEHHDFTHAAAFFDYDLDGDDDIFVNNNTGQCRLYNSDGSSFTDLAAEAGVAAAFHNLGVFGGDLNADGWPDILSFTEDKDVGFTYLNTGFGTFVDAAIEQFSTSLGYVGYAANAADIDNDGDLDVFYGGRMFRNEGGMTYTDITSAAGFGNIVFVCDAVFGDIDNDGDMDLFVNRQNRAPILLFRNDGTGHFQDISQNSSLGYFPTALSSTLGDIDNDGDLDLYTGAGYSDPNYLYLNDGSGYFVDITAESGTSCTNYTRAAYFFDADNDGDLDLVVANENRSSQLFVNDGTGHFVDATDQSGINDGLAKAGPAVVGDYDADGDMDLFIGRTDYIGNSFFKNKTNDGHFITVTPLGVISNRAGIGSKVYLYPAGHLGDPAYQFAYREYVIVNAFSSSGPNYVHFGTGAGELFDIRVIFPSGAVVEQLNVTSGSRLIVTESGEIPDYLVLIPSGFDFSFLEGDLPAQGQMTIKNSAGNSIPWTATVGASWCQLSAYYGATDQTISVTVDPAGMQPGNYETTITVMAEGAVNSPRNAVVRMTIAPNQPVLTLSTSSLSFIAKQYSYDPWPQAFSVLNTGQATLNWTLTTSSASWLSVEPQSGTAPTEVTVSCKTAGMSIGMHTATITVTAPGAVNSPATLTVNFEVTPGDVPERDTVRVASGAAQPGQNIIVPVYLHNVTEIAAFTVPLKFDPNVFVCDSVSFEGTRIEYIQITRSAIDTAQGKVLFGMVVFLEQNLQPGDGEIARLYMTVKTDIPEQVAVIDSAFYPPAGDFLLFNPASQAIIPEFVHGNIYIALNMFGDADGNGMVNVADGVYLISFIFKGQKPPIPTQAGDANTDDWVNVGDVVYIINYVFRGGPPPGYGKPVADPNPVYYTVEPYSGRDGHELRFIVDTDIPLGGAQIEIADPAGFATINAYEAGPLVNGMDVYCASTGRSHRFGILDLEGSGYINSGIGRILSVRYIGPDDLSVQSIHLFDQNGTELLVKYGLREAAQSLPDRYELAQNHPNPFNPATTIQYALVKPGHVTLTVFNVLGQTVRVLVNGEQKAGRYSVIWDGTDIAGHQVATGIYFYRLKTDGFTESRKMALIK